MGEAATEQRTIHIAIIAEIASAYVSRNHVQVADLPALISSVYVGLIGFGKPTGAEGPTYEKVTPAQIKKSIRHKALISFIDGKSYKTLKRHLTKHGLDIAAYRERYDLPVDYPTTAAAYSETRSVPARSLGLGRKNGPVSSAPRIDVGAPGAPKRRGRTKKAEAVA